MDLKEFKQKTELANATFNAMFSPNPETLSKFATECVKTDIERSPLSDNQKEFLKLWKDLGHELFATQNIKNAKAIYCKLDSLLMGR